MISLMNAIRDGKNVKAVKQIIEKYKINVSKINSWESSPLIVAISHNQMDIVQLLCQMGINVNIKSPTGKTPLINSVLTGNKNIMLCLLNYNSNVNDQDNYGITALHYACKYKQLEIIELLLNYDANILIKTYTYKLTSLDFANKIVILFIAFIQKKKELWNLWEL